MKWSDLSSDWKALILAASTVLMGFVVWLLKEALRARWKQLRVRCKASVVPLSASPAFRLEVEKLGWQEYVSEQSVVLDVRVENVGSMPLDNLTARLKIRGAVFSTAGWLPDVPDRYSKSWGIDQLQDDLVILRIGVLRKKDALIARFLLDRPPISNPTLVFDDSEVQVKL